MDGLDDEQAGGEREGDERRHEQGVRDRGTPWLLPWNRPS